MILCVISGYISNQIDNDSYPVKFTVINMSSAQISDFYAVSILKEIHKISIPHESDEIEQ